MPKSKKIKAWAVLYEGIWPIGNGNQWQYPIFPTRKAALEYRREPHGENGKIGAVLITPLSLRKKR